MRKLLPFLLLALAIPAWSDTAVPWYRSFGQALADARKHSKPIFVDVYTDWCVWCHELDQKVYSTPQFAKYMQGYIPVKLNAEDDKDGTQFAERYQVDGFPTLIVTDAYGKVTNRIGGYMDADALIKDMDAIQQLLRREKSRPDDVHATFQLAQEYMSRDLYAEAETRFLKVLISPGSTPGQKDEAQFSIALVQYYQHELDSALKSLEVYRKNYKNGESEEDAMLLLSQIDIEMDATEKARDTLKEFLAQFPNSENVSRAREVLDLLEKDLPFE